MGEMKIVATRSRPPSSLRPSSARGLPLSLSSSYFTLLPRGISMMALKIRGASGPAQAENRSQ